MLGISLGSEATHAFVFSRMKFIDEGAPKFRALSWVTFLGGLCSVS